MRDLLVLSRQMDMLSNFSYPTKGNEFPTYGDVFRWLRVFYGINPNITTQRGESVAYRHEITRFVVNGWEVEEPSKLYSDYYDCATHALDIIIKILHQREAAIVSSSG